MTASLREEKCRLPDQCSLSAMFCWWHWSAQEQSQTTRSTAISRVTIFVAKLYASFLVDAVWFLSFASCWRA